LIFNQSLAIKYNAADDGNVGMLRGVPRSQMVARLSKAAVVWDNKQYGAASKKSFTINSEMKFALAIVSKSLKK
jgi:hypothetical protein